jgi:enoyl-CoA hydratase
MMTAPAAAEAAGVLVDWPASGIVRLLLHRPERRNAIDERVLAGLNLGLDMAENARVVIVGSAVPGIFCSGADLTISEASRARVSDGLYVLYRRMTLHPAVVIAVLDGPAVGGGAQLAVAADMRIAQPSAWIRFVGPEHGLAAGAWALPSLVGRGHAIDLCLSGRPVAASEAAAIGLVDRLADDAMAESLALAAVVSGSNAGACRRVKAIVRRASNVLDALAEEAEGNRGWAGRVR